MNIIAEFSDNNGLNVKLTEDKIFISAIGNEETFALRGLNGIGVYDDIEKFNKELEDIRKKKDKKKVIMIICLLIGIVSLIANVKEMYNMKSFDFQTLIFSLIFFAVAYFNKTTMDGILQPKLETYLRIILSGGDRKFLFNKDAENAKSIAQFINKVEETLTSYNSK
jgi:hypothetical protein